MSLADRDYTRRDYKPIRASRFKPRSKSPDHRRFSCIRCGRSYSTKERAAACFKSHRPKSGGLTTISKLKKSITNLISKILGFIGGGIGVGHLITTPRQNIIFVFDQHPIFHFNLIDQFHKLTYRKNFCCK